MDDLLRPPDSSRRKTRELNSAFKPLTVLSVMTGTSLDGADAVCARLEDVGGTLDWEVLHRDQLPYPADMRRRLTDSLSPESSDVLTITQLHYEVGAHWAELCESAATVVRPDLVALSGQTIHHVPRVEPERGWRVKSTLQIGEAALTLERLGVPVMSDFRQSDMAAGGEGAPLVPFGDLKLYGQIGCNRTVHNHVSISIQTVHPASLDPDAVVAFYTGPGNCLIDEAAERYLTQPFDRDGAAAERGQVNAELLERLLQHPYLKLAAPKTTGREVFTLDVLLPELGASRLAAQLTAADLLATLTAFTAHSIARAYSQLTSPPDEIMVAGGGSFNPTLMRLIRELLPFPVSTFAEAGLDARDREALAFGVMAYYGWHQQPNTLPSATGARHPVIAGKLLLPWVGHGPGNRS